MINKTELRIGNTVQLKNGMQLVIIEMGVYSLKVDIVGGNTYVGATYENLQGIPLSPEILERYGFVEADDDGKYNLKKVWGVSLQHRYLADDGYDLYIFKQFIVQIHHLHHLQNVFHALALTNTELTAREG